MIETTRRTLIAGAAVLPTMQGSTSRAAQAGPFSDAAFDQVFEAYHAFGDKASGGAGDNACGAWLEARLTQWGYRASRQTFQAPAFAQERAELVLGDMAARVIPQAVVTPTGVEGVSARLAVAGQQPVT